MTTRATRSPRRRTVIALAVVLAVLCAFVVRLVDIQVVNADEHHDDSQIALGSGGVLTAARGDIVDAAGQPLATSILEYDCQLDPKLTVTVDGLIADGESDLDPWGVSSDRLAAVLGLSGDAVRAIAADALAENADSQFAYLVKGVSTEVYRDVVALELPYATCLPHPARSYPDGAVGGNLVGFMGEDGPSAGLELSASACLTGTDGSVAYQQGGDGVVIPGTEVTTPAVDGGTLTLTIDRDLQWYMQQLIAEQAQDMQANSGTITVVDVETGEVKAAAEWPSVDPNDPDASAADDRYSRIFTSSFEPGSTFKPLLAATLIDAGAATPTSTAWIPDRQTFPNGAVITDSGSHEPYLYTLAGVLIDSSNVGAATFSDLVSPQTRYDYLSRFGIGTGSAIEFGGQATGLLTDPSTWDNQTLYNTAFGQGLTTTIPELLGAYDAIANDGLRMPLSIVRSCTAADGTVTTPDLPDPVQVVSPAAAEQVQQMMENVALQSYLAPQIAISGYRIADKTGTGEKSDGNGYYKQGVYFTTMIGFAPANDPQYIVAVTLDEPKVVTSSAANAEAFQRAMTQVLKTYRITPDGSQPVVLPKFG